MQALHNNAFVRAVIKRVGFHYPKRFANKYGLFKGLSMPVWASEESSTIDTPAGVRFARFIHPSSISMILENRAAVLICGICREPAASRASSLRV